MDFPAGATWQKPRSPDGQWGTVSTPVNSLTTYCSKNQTVSCSVSSDELLGLENAHKVCTNCTCPEIPNPVQPFKPDTPPKSDVVANSHPVAEPGMGHRTSSSSSSTSTMTITSKVPLRTANQPISDPRVQPEYNIKWKFLLICLRLLQEQKRSMDFAVKGFFTSQIAPLFESFTASEIHAEVRHVLDAERSQ